MTSKSNKLEKFATFVMTGDTIIKTNSIPQKEKLNPSLNEDCVKRIETTDSKIENSEVLMMKDKKTSSKSIFFPFPQAEAVTNNVQANSIIYHNNHNETKKYECNPSSSCSHTNIDFPRKKIELQVPPDDISAEDEDFKGFVANADDLPPPPEHFFHKSNSSDGFCTFTSIHNGNQQQNQTILFENSIINDTSIPEYNLISHKASNIFSKITACSSEKDLIKDNGKDVLKRSMECDDVKSPERFMQEQLGSQSRVYRSHENYLQMFNTTDLSTMFLEEPGAISVDALNYEKIESSLNNVEAFLNSNHLCDIIDFSKRNSNIPLSINPLTHIPPQENISSQLLNENSGFINQLPNQLNFSQNNNDLVIQQQNIIPNTTNNLTVNTLANDQKSLNSIFNGIQPSPQIPKTNTLFNNESPLNQSLLNTHPTIPPTSHSLSCNNHTSKLPMKSTNHPDLLLIPNQPSDTTPKDETSSIDVSCAQRLANRLFNQDGFKPSDVSKHLSKNDPFSLLVGREYLKNFSFVNQDLDRALRNFLNTVVMEGETQEKERVLSHFSHQFVETNPRFGLSEDACHTLVCAMLLLNTDHHNQGIQKKMTQDEFLENLSGLNDLTSNYPPSLLITIYYSITNNPLPCLLASSRSTIEFPSTSFQQFSNPFLTIPALHEAREYKKGYVMKKKCVSSGGLRTSLGKRGWQMCFVVLRDMILYQYKDESEAKKASKQKLGRVLEHRYKYIRVHHSLTKVANDYQKKQFVFRLNTCDQAEYLFQTSDSTQCDSWVEKLNLVAACLSGAPLPSGVGSQKKKFQRPLMPSSYTKFSLREQYEKTMNYLDELEETFKLHATQTPKEGRPAVLQEFKEKEKYLEFELERFKVYCKILKDKMNGIIV